MRYIKWLVKHLLAFLVFLTFIGLGALSAWGAILHEPALWIVMLVLAVVGVCVYAALMNEIKPPH